MEIEAVEIKKEYVRHDALKISRLIHDQLTNEKVRSAFANKPAERA